MPRVTLWMAVLGVSTLGILAWGFAQAGKTMGAAQTGALGITASATKTHASLASSESPGAFEVVEYMGRLQRYAEKLYFSGAAGNVELAQFYAHELDEVAESLVGLKAVEEGRDLSVLVKVMLMPSIDSLAQGLKRDGLANFETHYAHMVQSCNRCHAAADHAFIRIQAPTRPAFTNQDFSPNLKNGEPASKALSLRLHDPASP
jgi:hypothetical protein